MNLSEIIKDIFIENAFVMSFLLIAAGIAISGLISKYMFRGKIPTSAVAIVTGLVIAFVGGKITGGSQGIADIDMFTGIGILGGSSLRDFAIISTAYGASLNELKKSGIVGLVSLFIGVTYAFILGAVLALVFGYTSPADIATIGARRRNFHHGSRHRKRSWRLFGSHRPGHCHRSCQIHCSNDSNSSACQKDQAGQFSFCHDIRRNSRFHIRRFRRTDGH